jgi:hypothetical protein
MYLVSLYEKDAVVEASLGGRVTADEIRVFAEELIELVAVLENRPFQMLLDYSKTKQIDVETAYALSEVKDRCFEAGAFHIITVADDQDLIHHQTMRLQQVLEGREQFVGDPLEARFVVPEAAQVRLSA